MSQGFDEILTAALTGDTGALGDLYRRHHPPLVRYLRSRQPREGEDLAADTWLDVARGLSRFEGDEPAFRAWLFTIGQRRLIDYQRKEIRRRTEIADSSDFDDRMGGDTEEMAVDAVSSRAALQMIARLPPEQAEVVLLRVVAGFDAPTVGEIVGKQAGAVRVIQHRALKRLAELLERAGVTQ